jgi:hypothetical protein
VTDPLAPLLDLAGVADAIESARAAADQAMRHRALRRSGGRVAAEISLRAATASAALEDRRYDLEKVREGLLTDPVVQGSLRVAGALDGLVDTWRLAPRQALARLHVLAAREVVDEVELGRPVPDPMVAARIEDLTALVTGGTHAPALLVAAVVEGELLSLRAFAGPYGVVARGAARLTLTAGGLDPRGLLAVEVGHLAREPEYIGSAGAFATGTPDGVRSWLRHFAAAVEVAAAELTTVCESIGT